MNSLLGELNRLVQSSPLTALAVLAAAVALATTPIAFAVLGRLQWFEARRGRTMLKPAFASVVASMMLVMGIPAILLGLLVKSQYYDRDRYEFDPNKTLTVLDQGRGLQVGSSREQLEQADEALRTEMKRLAAERKEMLDATKKLDDALLALGEAASQSQATSQPMIRAAAAMGSLRRVVGHDSEKSWDDLITRLEQAPNLVMVAGLPGAVAAPAGAAPVSAATAAFERELAGVPAPQRALAKALPLDDLPAGWETGDLGGKTLETFNAENLYEKIDGRAESFTQFDVTGMAYANFHPAGDTSGEVQLYIFEFGDALKAFGKYGTEKPQGAKPIAVGVEGYTDAGSVSFYQGKNFVQVVSTSDAPRFAEFSAALASKVADRLAGKPAGGAAPATAAATATAAAVSPTDVIKLLPEGPNREEPGYAAQDVFGYSFLSGVFLARYKDGEVTWHGFLRPYADKEAAKAVFEKYVAEARANEAKVEDVTIEGADRAVVIADSIGGLLDVIFLKGNSVGGANGANLLNADASRVRPPLERFSQAFATALPAQAPVLESAAPAAGGGYDAK